MISDETYDEIEMPANCADCGGVWDLNSLYPDMCCSECHRARAADQTSEDEQ